LAGQQHALSAGMQTQAEIWLGDRTVMDYLLSPVRKAWQEAARER
jgi:HlyD family secretion protein